MFLSSDTLLLRALEPDDLPLLYVWENDTSLWRYGSTLSPFSRYVLKEYIASCGGDLYETRQLRLMVVHRPSDACIGMVDLFDFDPHHSRAAVGILIAPAWQRQGCAREALALLHDYAFRFLGIRMLFAHVPLSNEPSLRLFDSAGYERRGVLRDWIRVGEAYEDVLITQKFNY
jgi:diamine N-acetyltransferase